MNAPATTVAELQRLLDGHAFTAEYAMRVEAIEYGRAVVRIPFQPRYVRPGGVIPGFIYMMAADVTMWLGLYTILGTPAELAVTTDMRTVFLSALRGEDFACDARVVDAGTQLLYGTAECRSLAGAIMTHHALTYIAPPASATSGAG